jgi:3-oxoisoapionate decarboxylase
MTLGIGSYACFWATGVPGYPAPAEPLTPFGLLQSAADLQVRLVQIADNLPLDQLRESELARLACQGRKMHVRIEVGTRGIGPEILGRYLNIAAQLGSPILRTVVDTASHRPEDDEIVETIRRLVPQFAERRVCLAIENHDRFKAAQLARIIERIGSPWVGVCLDTVNSFGSLEGPEAVVRTLGPHVVNLHLKDFTIRRADHMMGFLLEGCPAGEGQLDVPWLLGELRRYGSEPNAIIELWPRPEATVEATIAKEREWLRRSVANLRPWFADDADERA